ncbi:hypothetical protein CXF85_12090 [Colwellia sp. 75C3]|uniref:hypothetical protein n=1 Tax=Colwellia sp. 75C3 TaxID=888425 RepID=UPI000C336534|nr:hypothetical protein [Colwellia sp. 75C3]PKG82868.1 hypothetical protein CXF85_12090 [Colwellia sp. 75C3]
MKYLTALIFGFVFLFGLSFLITPYLNEIYIYYNDIQPGPDGESELFSFFMYVQWPVFFLIGLIVGYLMHIKYL